MYTRQAPMKRPVETEASATGSSSAGLVILSAGQQVRGSQKAVEKKRDFMQKGCYCSGGCCHHVVAEEHVSPDAGWTQGNVQTLRQRYRLAQCTSSGTKRGHKHLLLARLHMTQAHLWSSAWCLLQDGCVMPGQQTNNRAGHLGVG